jgi:hypothetical protein
MSTLDWLNSKPGFRMLPLVIIRPYRAVKLTLIETHD